MPHTAPVRDWATDFDVLDPRYVTDPFSIWDELRQSCPIAQPPTNPAWLMLRAGFTDVLVTGIPTR